MPSEQATAAERARFAAARPGDSEAAETMLADYLAWRSSVLPLPAGAKTLGNGLPNLAHVLPDGVKCKDGKKILCVLGAMYDANAGTSEEYAIALAACFDAHLSRDSSEKVTVLIDARGGDGWPNPRPWSVLPWLRALVGTLAPNFPERLHRLVFYPMPWVASAAWSAVSAFLDERTAAKVCVLSGSASRTSPVPDGIDEYVDASVLAACAAYREASLGAPGTGAPPVTEDAASAEYAAAAAATSGVALVGPPDIAKPPAKPPAPASEEADYGLDELALA